jgi:nucleotide-binding universal stress UspA family protein
MRTVSRRAIRPLRVLIAADESPGAERARDLLRKLLLPPGSRVRAVRVVDPGPAAVSLAGAAGTELMRGALPTTEAGVAAFAGSLRREGLAVESRAVTGRPGSAIVAEAERWPADLLVIGSRGRGAVASALLGSVASEVVDHSPCPVLVARASRVSSIVLADDGSADASVAAQVIGSRLFAAPVLVVSVAHITAPLSSGVAPTMRAAARDAEREASADAREEHAAIARRRVARLRGAGLEATTGVREGDPGDEILLAAEESGADLIAVGTRGRTGLGRLVLGSVAHKVLHRTKASVLVARSRPG